MTPATIIRDAQSEGVRLTLSPTGTLKATGDDKAVRRWLGVIREHKGQLIDALQVGAGDTAHETDRGIAYRTWLIHYSDRDPVQSYCTPPATHAEILASHPAAIAAEPFEPAQMRDIPVISAKDEQAIRSWLEQIGETDAAIIADVMQRCQQDSEARAYFTDIRQNSDERISNIRTDDRRTCSQCKNLSGRVCSIACPGGVVSAVKGYTPNRTTLMRCAGFVTRGTA